MADKGQWQELEAAGHFASTVRRQRVDGWCSCSFLFLHSLGPKPIETPSQTRLQGRFFSDARLGKDDDIKHHI